MGGIIERMAEAIFIDRNGERNRKRFNEQRVPYIKDAKAALSVVIEELELYGCTPEYQELANKLKEELR